MTQESLTLPNGVRIVEMYENGQYVTTAKWPPDKHGDTFFMAWAHSADIFHDSYYAETFLAEERAAAERTDRAQWCDWDRAFS